MMLKEEKHTSSAVAFKVDISDAKAAAHKEEPQIKKKLESYSKAAQPATLDSIQDKLKRAEEKRKISLLSQNSPKTQERRKQAMEKKRSRDINIKQHVQQKIERDLSDADEKRKANKQMKMQKLRQHIAKVEVIRKEQAVKRKESTDSLK